MATWKLALILSLPIAGCSWDSGLDFLARTVAGTGGAWCRHADNCYPVYDPEEMGHTRPDRADGLPESHHTQ